MTKEEFMVEMQEVLQTDAELNADTALADLDEWDSLAIMATMAFLDKHFGVKMKLADFRALSTVGDIAAKVGL